MIDGLQHGLRWDEQVIGISFDHRAEAKAAIETAAAASCDADRLKWIRIALAWQDLAGGSPARRRERSHLSNRSFP
jgi:hypothetical protein